MGVGLRGDLPGRLIEPGLGTGREAGDPSPGQRRDLFLQLAAQRGGPIACGVGQLDPGLLNLAAQGDGPLGS